MARTRNRHFQLDRNLELMINPSGGPGTPEDPPLPEDPKKEGGLEDQDPNQ